MSTTLFGFKIIAVKFEDGRDGEFTVRQFKLKEYPQAMRLLDDEFALAALACDVNTGLVAALHPESFEKIHAALQEVNATGFFTYAARQAERNAQNLRSLPPELIEKMISSRLSATSLRAAT